MNPGEIVLATLNARYHHASLALRYLYANMGDLQSRTFIAEFTISQSPEDIVERLLEQYPNLRIIGFGIYIWNVLQTESVLKLLRSRRPDIRIILGGPEISHETTDQAILRHSDYVICGEADEAFAALCSQLDQSSPPPDQIIQAELPSFESLDSPYPFYSDHDLATRSIYVEASRGCPFRCEFCLSSLDQTVRYRPLEVFLSELTDLIQRGTRQLRFIDRTFNLRLDIARRILEFLLPHTRNGLFLHFEMVPDRLPQELRQILSEFPPGSVQFEVGIQTFHPDVAERIDRRLQIEKTEDNLRFLRSSTGIHIHADLIAGLPGEDELSFGAGFDRLIRLEPHEIQVGILKRLRGTPIAKHDIPWEMSYDPNPPYSVRSTRTMTEETIQRLKRFSSYWDRIANSGRFPNFCDWLLRTERGSPYQLFMQLSIFLFDRFHRTHSIDLDDLNAALADFSNTTIVGTEKSMVLLKLEMDREFRSRSLATPSVRLPTRQARHVNRTSGLSRANA